MNRSKSVSVLNENRVFHRSKADCLPLQCVRFVPYFIGIKFCIFSSFQHAVSLNAHPPGLSTQIIAPVDAMLVSWGTIASMVSGCENSYSYSMGDVCVCVCVCVCIW